MFLSVRYSPLNDASCASCLIHVASSYVLSYKLHCIPFFCTDMVSETDIISVVLILFLMNSESEIWFPTDVQAKEFCEPVFKALDLKYLLPLDSKGVNILLDMSGSISWTERRMLTICLKASKKGITLVKACFAFGTKTVPNGTELNVSCKSSVCLLCLVRVVLSVLYRSVVVKMVSESVMSEELCAKVLLTRGEIGKVLFVDGCIMGTGVGCTLGEYSVL
jgi:hypothetical protein